MIALPDACVGSRHTEYVDTARNVSELIVEFLSRRDFIAVYVGCVGLWLLWPSFRGLAMSQTRSFGWRAGDVHGRAATVAGRIWLAVAVGLMGSGAGLWLTV